MPIALSSHALSQAGFAHGFSTRAVDLSVTAPAPDYVEALGRFCREAGLSPSKLRHANQVHGAVVVMASEVALAKRPEADALVSFGELCVGVRVADCVPILVGDRESGAVAAIHAGWKGFVAGVIPAALAKLGAGSRLVAAIGPCIGPCCFEVGEEVAATIERAAGVRVSRPSKADDKRLVDLRAGARAHLARCGVAPASIDDVEGCTRCDEARFFSYRRSAETGRMLAAIAPLLP